MLNSEKNDEILNEDFYSLETCETAFKNGVIYL